MATVTTALSAVAVLRLAVATAVLAVTVFMGGCSATDAEPVFACSNTTTSTVSDGKLCSVDILGLFPFTGGLRHGGTQRSHAARLAVAAVNSDPSLLQCPHGKIRLRMDVYDTATNPTTAARHVLSHLGTSQAANRQSVAVVGAASSTVSKSVASLGAILELPQVSYSSTNAALSDKEFYPFFTRVVATDEMQGVALAWLVQHHGWDRVSVIAGATDYARGLALLFDTAVATAHIQQGNNTSGDAVIGTQVSMYIHDPVSLVADAGTDPDARASALESYVSSVDTSLSAIKRSGDRVIMMSNTMLDAMAVLSRAQELGVIGYQGDDENGDPIVYQWIGTDGWIGFSPESNSAAAHELGIGEDISPLASHGIVGAVPYSPDKSVWMDQTWNPTVGSALLTDYQKSQSGLDSWQGEQINTYAPFAWDAVMLVAHAVDGLCASEGEGSVFDGPGVLARMLNTTIDGVTGTFQLQAAVGNRAAEYVMMSYAHPSQGRGGTDHSDSGTDSGETGTATGSWVVSAMWRESLLGDGTGTGTWDPPSAFSYAGGLPTVPPSGPARLDGIDNSGDNPGDGGMSLETVFIIVGTSALLVFVAAAVLWQRRTISRLKDSVVQHQSVRWTASERDRLKLKLDMVMLMYIVAYEIYDLGTDVATFIVVVSAGTVDKWILVLYCCMVTWMTAALLVVFRSRLTVFRSIYAAFKGRLTLSQPRETAASNGGTHGGGGQVENVGSSARTPRSPMQRKCRALDAEGFAEMEETRQGVCTAPMSPSRTSQAVTTLTGSGRSVRVVPASASGNGCGDGGINDSAAPGINGQTLQTESDSLAILRTLTRHRSSMEVNRDSIYVALCQDIPSVAMTIVLLSQLTTAGDLQFWLLILSLATSAFAVGFKLSLIPVYVRQRVQTEVMLSMYRDIQEEQLQDESPVASPASAAGTGKIMGASASKGEEANAGANDALMLPGFVPEPGSGSGGGSGSGALPGSSLGEGQELGRTKKWKKQVRPQNGFQSPAYGAGEEQSESSADTSPMATTSRGRRKVKHPAGATGSVRNLQRHLSILATSTGDIDYSSPDAKKTSSLKKNPKKGRRTSEVIRTLAVMDHE